MTWEEFQGVTLAQLEALEERRAIQIRHARYDAALVAAAICNQNLPVGEIAISPFDFIPGFEPDPEEREALKLRKKITRNIRYAFAKLPGATTTPEQVRELRAKMVTRLQAQGHADAEEILKEAYPDL
jgi:hypothetical protein